MGVTSEIDLTCREELESLYPETTAFGPIPGDWHIRSGDGEVRCLLCHAVCGCDDDVYVHDRLGAIHATCLK